MRDLGYFDMPDDNSNRFKRLVDGDRATREVWHVWSFENALDVHQEHVVILSALGDKDGVLKSLSAKGRVFAKSSTAFHVAIRAFIASLDLTSEHVEGEEYWETKRGTSNDSVANVVFQMASVFGDTLRYDPLNTYNLGHLEISKAGAPRVAGRFQRGQSRLTHDLELEAAKVARDVMFFRIFSVAVASNPPSFIQRVTRLLPEPEQRLFQMTSNHQRPTGADAAPYMQGI